LFRQVALLRRAELKAQTLDHLRRDFVLQAKQFGIRKLELL
jgi:hypothetical protein